jgi:hypothetical protein
MAQAPLERPLPLHPDAFFLTLPGRELVLRPERQTARRRIVQLHRRTHWGLLSQRLGFDNRNPQRQDAFPITAHSTPATAASFNPLIVHRT